ncbi:MAG: helix-turn-helix transcriptional regulator, partial [Streptomycetaceae bacterium]|nr:helix-turn-helix transcriptional regulator [Streptomycetaceae bacterium]
PLALKELASALDQPQRTGSAPLPPALAAPDAVARTFRRRLAELGPGARMTAVVAAADRSGRVDTLLAAARGLGCELRDLDEAVGAGVLVVTGDTYAFRHPLIRSTAYQDATVTDRVNAHRSLADALDDGRPGEGPPDLAATWHRALAATGPDAGLAADLERAADVTWARGGSPAEAYQLAAGLHPEGADRARLLVRAAQTALVGGATDYALDLSSRAAELTEDPLLHGALAMVDGTAANFRGRTAEAAHLLAAGAERLITAAQASRHIIPKADEHTAPASAFPPLALLTVAAGYAWSSGDARTLRRTAELARRAEPDAAATRALTGLAALADESSPALGIPPLTELVERERATRSSTLIARLFALRLARILGHDAAVTELAQAEAARCRARGTVTALPDVLAALAQAQSAAGLHHDAAATAAEALDFARETGQAHVLDDLHSVSLRIAAITGDEERARSIVAERPGLTEDPALALLDLTLGRYDAAVTRLEAALNTPGSYRTSLTFAIPDLVEAAVRGGHADASAKPLARFTAWAEAAPTAWSRAVALRSRALVAPDSDAEPLFTAAITEHLSSTRPFEQARTELRYGEWLRRHRRRVDARPVLHAAEARFARLGAASWAARAQSELRATGGEAGASPTPVEPSTAALVLDALTPQELQVVRLAAGGASNQEIATQLFLSRRTVEYHLYKAYPKLGIGSRRELMRLGVR